VRVRDWGRGIPAQDAPSIFQPGFSTKNGHVGVGLALVRGIVHRACGELELEAGIEPGASVVVRIPAAT
jgi:signal transduction histidine kinase